MSGPYPLATLGPTITSAGISAPTYADILASLQASFASIYGSDAYVAPDSQDGQMLAIFAQAIFDSNSAAVMVYNSFSPSYAQGAALSGNVRINGLTRLVPSFSTAVGTVVGTVGITIANGVVADENGNLWNLPSSVTIPLAGSISVTVTAQVPGAISAGIGTINQINTPTQGWQSFSNTGAANPGNPVETDAQLRIRQSLSAALPASTPAAAMLAQILEVPNVTRAIVYENPTGSIDANGAPPHSIYVVVAGGTIQSIINAIGLTKTPGANTYGTTSGTYIDPATGLSYVYNFFVLGSVSVNTVVNIHTGNGYSSTVATAIQAAVANFLNTLPIGQLVSYFQVAAAAQLRDDPSGATFELKSITINGGTVDIAVAYNQAATSGTVTVNLV